MAPLTFETARLTADRLSPDHLDDLIALHLDEEVCRHIGGVRSPETTAAFLRASLDHWDRRGFGLWALRTRDGAFAGRGGIVHVQIEGRLEVELSYTLHRAFWGCGLATELAQALVALWRTERLSPTLLGIVYVEHGASRKIMEKAGLLYERDGLHDGHPVALYRTAL